MERTRVNLIQRKRFDLILLAMLSASLLSRLAYVYFRVVDDPTFTLHSLDSAYYLEWAQSLAAGEGGPAGAFSLAPLYPYVLWLFTLAFGENLALLYCVQQALVVGAGGLLALTGRRLLGDTVGLTACALMLVYHPLLALLHEGFELRGQVLRRGGVGARDEVLQLLQRAVAGLLGGRGGADWCRRRGL